MAGVVRHVVRHVEMPYVEVIRRAHLVDGVVERMVGRHRSERAVQVTRMIRTMRAIISVGEVELGQRFTRVVIGVALAAVVGRLGVAMVLLRQCAVCGSFSWSFSLACFEWSSSLACFEWSSSLACFEWSSSLACFEWSSSLACFEWSSSRECFEWSSFL